MFSSNQVLKISGNIVTSDLSKALVFVLDYFNMGERKLAYQITEDGDYCLGWYTYEGYPEDGWTAFPFEFEPDVNALIIRDHLKDQILDLDGFNGETIQEGFLIRSIRDLSYNDLDKIRNNFYGIVIITPYTLYYR